jgi:hypothetical protein
MVIAPSSDHLPPHRVSSASSRHVQVSLLPDQGGRDWLLGSSGHTAMASECLTPLQNGALGPSSIPRSSPFGPISHSATVCIQGHAKEGICRPLPKFCPFLLLPVVRHPRTLRILPVLFDFLSLPVLPFRSPFTTFTTIESQVISKNPSPCPTLQKTDQFYPEQARSLLTA